MAKVKRKKIIFTVALLSITAVVWFLYAGIEAGGFFRVTPSQTSSVYHDAEYPVFVYGTLRLSLVRHLVFGADGEPEPAMLPGFTRRGLDLVEEERSRVHGLLLEVGPAELAALDRYERLGVRYRRDRVMLADGTEAWVYRRR